MEQTIISVRYAEDLSPKGQHFHDCYQLIYVADGSAAITVNGTEYIAKPNTALLIGRFETHSIRILTTHYRRYTVMISPDIHAYHQLMGDKLLSVLVNRPAGFCHAADMSDLPQAATILRQMADESEIRAPMQDTMQLLLLSQLLILFCRKHPKSIPEDAGNLKLIQQVRQYLEENFASICTLEELAARFHLSQSHLSHLFKDVTGTSIIGYLTAYRIAQAKHYLLETDWQISKISSACGFSDHSNFGRTFRSTTGLSPSQFRKKYR